MNQAFPFCLCREPIYFLHANFLKFFSFFLNLSIRREKNWCVCTLTWKVRFLQSQIFNILLFCFFKYNQLTELYLQIPLPFPWATNWHRCRSFRLFCSFFFVFFLEFFLYALSVRGEGTEPSARFDGSSQFLGSKFVCFYFFLHQPQGTTFIPSWLTLCLLLCLTLRLLLSQLLSLAPLR